MSKQEVFSANAPKVIGCYSQAVSFDDTIYLSMEKGFIPETMQLAVGFENQLEQTFKNLNEIAKAANTNINHIVKLLIYVTDIANAPLINKVMEEYFTKPYPARGVIEVRALPVRAIVAVDATIRK